jgi:branched-chain amino acid aminotransferase
MRVVWLDGALVEPSRAALSIDDPGVRWGEGLFETMRAERGRVAQLERHLDRLSRSAATLGLAPMPQRQTMRAAVAEALAAGPGGPRRVRLTATPGPTLLIDVTPVPALAEQVAAVSAVTVPGAWNPGAAIAEHKCLSYAAHRWSQRLATRTGADHALLLDAEGRLGEAALGSAFCVIDGALFTAPVEGLLPGVARAVVIGEMAVHEESPPQIEWRAASEIVLTNAVAGAVAIVAVDGVAIGDGAVGPMGHAIGALLRTALAAARLG